MECYVCHDQDGNAGKCLKTIQTCEQDQDRCLSSIVWSTTPYWSQVCKENYQISLIMQNKYELYESYGHKYIKCYIIMPTYCYSLAETVIWPGTFYIIQNSTNVYLAIGFQDPHFLDLRCNDKSPSQCSWLNFTL